jgi:hypothetical protein
MKYQGDLTLKEIKEVVAELALVIKEKDCSFLLNDFNKANIKLSTIEIYELPKIMKDIYASSGINVHSLTRAAVVVKDYKDAHFFETVSVNSGQAVKVFYDIDKARNWVLDK